jgi:hypothetical protein
MALALIVLMLAGCAHHYTQTANNDPYGFFSGLWHGAIFPITAIVNIISWLLGMINVTFLSNVEIVGRPNTGLFYYFGFAVGLAFASGSGTRT